MHIKLTTGVGITALLIGGLTASVTAQTLIPQGSVWQYWDDASPPASDWNQLSCTCNWAEGITEIGYGDGDERHVVNSQNRRITTYFRHEFQMAPIAQFLDSDINLRLRLLRDDGAAVYLNGIRVYRTNLDKQSDSTIDHTDRARDRVGGFDNENSFQEQMFSFDYNDLITGPNVVAVEVHQFNTISSDLSFDFELSVAGSSKIVRGPYLQQGSTDSVKIRWRTADKTPSYVRYAMSLSALIAGNHQEVFDASLSNEHNIRLTGLQPDTTYFYAVGTKLEDLAGKHASFSFKTHPLEIDSDRLTRVWVLGDSGDSNIHSKSVKNAYLRNADAHNQSTDVWLMLGDNAYYSGTTREFDRNLFHVFPTMLRSRVLWSTIGNHDADDEQQAYYDLFSFPRNAEAGGIQSGTEAYYSFDYNNIHFISLDSVADPNSTEMQGWLKRDLLAAKTKNGVDWIIVFFHHAPYTKGTHDSDDPNEYRDRIRKMRWNFTPIFDEFGVDLVLGGHSHVYERSYLLQGHYGQSSELDSEHMILNSGNGTPSTNAEEDNTYRKTAGFSQPNSGTVYVVAGSASKKGDESSEHFYQLNHPALVAFDKQDGSLKRNGHNLHGSLFLDIRGQRLEGRFLDEQGRILDHFALDKSAPVASKQRVKHVSLRGSHNSWGSTPMTLISHYTWETRVNLTANSEFKFDINRDGNTPGWTLNFGENNADWFADKNGRNIKVSDIIPNATSGEYEIRFNTIAEKYSVKRVDP
jgi:hypothetical protein